MTTKNTYISDLAIPPGEYLEEVLDEFGMTKEELARRMGRPASKLSQIFNGTKRITEETALQLEKVVGVPAHIWTGLESEYRLTLARQSDHQQEEKLKEEGKLATAFCYSELMKLGEVPDTRKPVERARALHSYFGVTSLFMVTESQRYQAAFRCGTDGERKAEALAAWLRYGERRAQGIETAQLSEKKLRAVLDDLRSLTEKTPAQFEPELKKMLAACGVALVICPHFPKTNAHGATFRLSSTKAVLMITVRGTWADVFWFSIFHEIGHILLHGSSVIIENGEEDEREQEANDFACNLLVPAAEYNSFVKADSFSKNRVCAFARSLGVHPGVVVGRLQHDSHIDHSWLHDLRIQLHLKNQT